MPLVTAIIPTYNRATTLPRAVDSVLRQTHTQMQLIIVDDASTDHTKEYVFSLTDPRISYIRHTENRGGSAARNSGLRAANGQYVAFLDSDDEWLVNKTEACLASLSASKSSTEAVLTAVHRVFQDGTELTDHLSPNALQLQRLYAKPPIGAGSSLMARRNCLEEIGGFDEELERYQDWDLVIRLVSRFNLIIIDEPLTRKFSTGIPDLDSAITASKYFRQKHRTGIAAEPLLPRQRIRGEHRLHLMKLAIAHRRWSRTAIEAASACFEYPPFIRSVLRAPILARFSQRSGSTSIHGAQVSNQTAPNKGLRRARKGRSSSKCRVDNKLP